MVFGGVGCAFIPGGGYGLLFYAAVFVVEVGGDS